jgi:VWFA-related protein
MRRAFTAVPWAVAAATTALLAQQPAPAPQFRTGVDIVMVEATVLDKQDALVTGLTPADFAVQIGGRSREIASVELVRHETAATAARPAEPDISTNVAIGGGRTILLAVDRESLTVENRALLDAAGRWVAKLGPGDRIGLVTLPLPGINEEFTTNHQRIVDVLAGVTPTARPPVPFPSRNVGLWEAFRIKDGDSFVEKEVLDRECPPGRREPSCPDEVQMQAEARASEAQTHVVPVLRSLDALMRGMNVLPGPKHVVLVTSGWPISEAQGAREMAIVATQAALSNTTVHTFTGEQAAMSASRSKLSPTVSQDRNLLMSNVEMLSGMTGGRAVRLAGAGDLAFASLTEGLSGYYRLAVRAQPEDLDGKPRQIALKVLRDGVRLASYRRLLAANAKVPRTAEPAAALRGALESPTPITELELRATTYFLHGTDAASRALRVIVVGDVGGATAGEAKAVAALYTLDGKAVTAMENTVAIPIAGPASLSVALSAPPGAYILRLAVRDADGHLGSLERPLDARWRRIGAVEAPGLVLLRADLGERGAPKPVFRTVTPAEQVIAQVPLVAPAGQMPQVTFDVRGEDAVGGPPLTHQLGLLGASATGVMVAEAVIPIAALQPGRYTVTATVAPETTPAFGRSFVVESPSASPP